MPKNQELLVYLAIGICVVSKILIYNKAGVKTPQEAFNWIKKEFGVNAE